MAETPINGEHLEQLARMQHIGEWLQQEQERAAAELRHVMAQATRHAQEVTAFLQRHYGLDAQHTPVQLDVEHGVLRTPELAQTQEAADESPFLVRDTAPAAASAAAPSTTHETDETPQ